MAKKDYEFSILKNIDEDGNMHLPPCDSASGKSPKIDTLPSAHDLQDAPDIKELIERPVIRPEQGFKWLQKLSAEEEQQWEAKVLMNAKADPHVENEGHELMSRTIDREILYDLFSLTPEELREKMKDYDEEGE